MPHQPEKLTQPNQMNGIDNRPEINNNQNSFTEYAFRRESGFSFNFKHIRE